MFRKEIKTSLVFSKRTDDKPKVRNPDTKPKKNHFGGYFLLPGFCRERKVAILEEKNSVLGFRCSLQFHTAINLNFSQKIKQTFFGVVALNIHRYSELNQLPSIPDRK